MSRVPTGNKTPTKDMYWFAHGGIESNSDKCLPHSITSTDMEDESGDSISPTWKLQPDRRSLPEEQKTTSVVRDTSSYTVTDGGGSSSSGPSSLERDEKVRISEKRLAVEERRKMLWEAEQERNDAVLRKRLEREAALEARRNAQRSNISFAFGSSVPRNVESLHANQGGEPEKINRISVASGLLHKEESYNYFHERRSVSPFNCSGHDLMVDSVSPLPNPSQSCTYSERKTMSPPCWLTGSGAVIGDDIMSRSMNASIPAPRGRRKNDLMPTVPYDRIATPRTTANSSTRKRSVSMTRLDQLAQPRRHYVEANKANSTSSGDATSLLKDNVRSPTRPLSSASEQSGGSGRISGSVTRRVRSSPRKPRPVSIAGTVPDHKPPFETKVSPAKRSYTPNKKISQVNELKKAAVIGVKSSPPKSAERAKPTPRPASAVKSSSPKPTTPKPAKQPAAKVPAVKQSPAAKTSTPKTHAAKKSSTNKKKADILVATPATAESIESRSEDAAKTDTSPPGTPPPNADVNVENEKNNAKHIISEEEAKAALAEKRRLAREQAEKEAELERQRQEELRLEEEERLRKEEEEQKRMEEEQLHLIAEHHKQEEEKLRKAIQEQERKEEEEKAKREEELRLKTEHERKAKEEAEKQRIELEEKLRKEEEERAERKKRLEKIMSRTRGKSSGTSPSGSVSGSDQLDSGENVLENFSSGTNSLDSNEAAELPSEQVSVDDNQVKSEQYSAGNSLDANPTYEVASESESLNSNDLMMPLSETASQDNSLLIIPDKNDLLESTATVDVVSSDSNPNADFPASQLEVHSPTLKLDSVVLCSVEKMTFNESPVEISAPVSHVSQDVAEVPPLEGKSSVSEAFDAPEENEQFELETPLTKEVANVEMSQLVFDQKQLPYDVQDAPELAGQKSFNSVDPEEVQFNLETYNIKNFEENCADPDDVMLAFNEDVTEIDATSNDTLNLQNTSTADCSAGFAEPDKKLAIENVFSSVVESGLSEEADMKLPDPNYETSDEGSISSERHQQEFRSYMPHVETVTTSNKEPASISDEVFSEQEIVNINNSGASPTDEFVEEQKNALLSDGSDMQKNSTSDYETQFQLDGTKQVEYDMEESLYAHETSAALPEVLEQPREIGEESFIPSTSSAYSRNESEFYQNDVQVKKGNPSTFLQDAEADKENTINDMTFDIPSSSTNPLLDEESKMNEYDVYADKENIHISESEMDFFGISGTAPSSEIHKTDTSEEVKVSAVDSLFSSKCLPGDSELNSCSTQPHTLVACEQIQDIKNQTASFESHFASNADEFGDVMLIKAEDSEHCVGIISSIDHDRISNDFPKPHLYHEQLKSNVEYASVTDSDSSLDSNLSQIILEGSEKETTGGLNSVENSILESSTLVSNNVEQSGNPFQTEHTYNGDSVLKSNGNHFCATEGISNGHRLESSIHNYMQLDGNDISTVDHTRNNIFENVDAIEFSKVSPDPFLAKGNSNQISGNPFLVQDDSKPVLVTPDFFN